MLKIFHDKIHLVSIHTYKNQSISQFIQTQKGTFYLGRSLVESFFKKRFKNLMANCLSDKGQQDVRAIV